jgi:hypothetical protein
MVVVVAAAALTVVLSAFEGLKGLSTQYAYEHSPAYSNYSLKPRGFSPSIQKAFKNGVKRITRW